MGSRAGMGGGRLDRSGKLPSASGACATLGAGSDFCSLHTAGIKIGLFSRDPAGCVRGAAVPEIDPSPLHWGREEREEMGEPYDAAVLV